MEKRFLQLGNLLFESKVDEERCGVSPGGGLVGGWKVASRLRLGIDSIQCWTAIGVDGVGELEFGVWREGWGECFLDFSTARQEARKAQISHQMRIMNKVSLMPSPSLLLRSSRAWRKTAAREDN